MSPKDKNKTKKNTKIQKWWGKHVLGFLKICYIVRFSNVLSLSVIKRFDKKMSYSSNCMVIEMNRVNKRYQWTEKLINKWLKITYILFKHNWWKKKFEFFSYHNTTVSSYYIVTVFNNFIQCLSNGINMSLPFYLHVHVYNFHLFVF